MPGRGISQATFHIVNAIEPFCNLSSPLVPIDSARIGETGGGGGSRFQYICMNVFKGMVVQPWDDWQ
ncbi:hypothetical protein NIES30_25215 [Phormidium tenue NIES-30]|uniref:Uncharacterized protein n=1 Tax=Phormidium tenue NIES-30 TaxID=549789 RepID=A0A1U7IY51_9CYAN|nr:hypothetical protein NIES30_25215 [Phormidium tenue NIES-30]